MHGVCTLGCTGWGGEQGQGEEATEKKGGEEVFKKGGGKKCGRHREAAGARLMKGAK